MTYSRTYSKGNVKVTEKGDLFDRARAAGVLNKGIANGTRKLLPKVESIVAAKLPTDTGRHRQSVTSKLYGNGLGVVMSKDPRKIREWIETGRRKGVKTARKGAYAWRAGKAFVRSERKDGYYREEIAKVLRG